MTFAGWVLTGSGVAICYIGSMRVAYLRGKDAGLDAAQRIVDRVLGG